MRGLFAAHFGEGQLLSDHGVLRDVAAAAGLDEALTAEVLAGDAFALEVRADEAAARERDVTGVPYFLINGAWPVPGAQDVETMGIVLRRGLVTSRRVRRGSRRPSRPWCWGARKRTAPRSRPPSWSG